MPAYYNENDPYAAQWLRNLIAAGHIAPGDVDERSIVDVRAGDLAGYEQCHFFAGIGGWSLALRLAGWPDDRPVWTGSCPCQPFSAAGKGKAANDERHLWPAWLPLIAERRPATVFGEQVDAAIGWGWLDLVFADLEAEGYACGAAVLPSCGIGAPHIRDRLWFVAHAVRAAGERGAGSVFRTETQERGARLADGRIADGPGDGGEVGLMAHADGRDSSAEGLQRSGEHGQRQEDGGAGGVADSDILQPEQPARPGARPGEAPGGWALGQSTGRSDVGGVADALHTGRPEGRPLTRHRSLARSGGPSGVEHSSSIGRERGQETAPGYDDDRQAPERSQGQHGPGLASPHWSSAVWLPCTDGKSRPVEPGTFPLAHGIPKRVGRLRAYGNAITPQLAAEFIRASEM